ncbi:MAG: iron-sulfur cluster repair di-iron protein [Polyangiaceae bacterium]
MLNASEKVAHVVLDHSECAEVFQRYRIDFCCGGDISVERAAHDKGVDVAVLVRELDAAIRARHEGSDAHPKDLPTSALVRHIVDTHHAYLRRTLPFLLPLAAKVARVHGERNAKLRALSDTLTTLAKTLYSHLDDEELNLFPLLLTDGEQARKDALLASMLEEHLSVAKLLEELRAAADDYTLPDWACNSYKALFSELAALEKDIFTHVHLENHVLRPRFGGAPS